MGQPVRFRGEPTLGDIRRWRWEFGDGAAARGIEATHTYVAPGTYNVSLDFASADHEAHLTTTVAVGPPVEARITPLEKQVRAGEVIVFDGSSSRGAAEAYGWRFDDGSHASEAQGQRVTHTFERSGIYRVTLTVTQGPYRHSCFALVRAHGPQRGESRRSIPDCREMMRITGVHLTMAGDEGRTQHRGIGSHRRRWPSGRSPWGRGRRR